jgi:hypothetical protein
VKERSRLALIAGLIIVAAAVFAGCSSGTSVTKGVTHIQVKGGKPVGGVKTIVVNKGQPARFTVASDVSDEVHVHGYNLHKDVKPGASVSFDFPAKIDGIFVIELEGRSQQIGSLQVNP